MTHQRVFVRVPASTANLGPGFDTLGMALTLYAYLEVAFAQPTADGRISSTIEMHGDTLHGLPTDKSNLIYEICERVYREAGGQGAMPELAIQMYSDIPLTRGLGSSASAIVAALVGMNALLDYPLTQDQLFQLATTIEGHPDNVGASMFGGIVAAFWDGRRAEHVRIEPSPTLDVLVAVPTFQLSTEKARHALPAQVTMQDAVFNVGATSLLVAALASGHHEVIQHAMRDRLHQPYRAALIPGMSEILQHASEYGALGVALSGAGPTLLALIDTASSHKKTLQSFLADTFAKHGIEATTKWLKPARSGVGAQLLKSDDARDFMTLVRGANKR